MNLPRPISDQQHLAEIRSAATEPLVVSTSSQSIGLTTHDSFHESFFVHLDHTPSPPGQQDALASSLPPFFETVVLGDTKKVSKPSAVQNRTFRAGRFGKSTRGKAECLFRNSHSSPCCAADWSPVAIPLVNKRWAVPRLVRASQPSQMAASRRARPLGPQATSRTANSTRANVTNTFSAARIACRPASFYPARLAPLRGFSVLPKTQKDTACSRKS